MLVVGLTGGFGTGKTTVANMFKELGARIVDADKIAHDVIRNKKDIIKKIVCIFGRTILRKDGLINRRRLGEAAFIDKKNIKALMALIHPEVKLKINIILDRIRQRDEKVVVVLDVPLLIEADMHSIVDVVIVVTADEAIQLKRCKARTGLSMGAIKRRIAFQLPIREKTGFAEFVIDNSGDRGKTRRQVRRIWERLNRN